MNRSYDDIKNAEPYGRISIEDKDKRNFSMESESISSQRELILQFCERHNIAHKRDGYYDDGITGQTFDRENFQQLIKDIENGLVDCVITKDLSRLGRDHTETGYYIERYFPEHGVRYISINDDWDSKYDPIDMILWKLAYNDVYCADISKKIKSKLNSKKAMGLWMTSFAPYGYIKNPEDKHKLIPDPEYAPIVKECFELSYSGLGNCAIANMFTEKGYLTPGEKTGRHPRRSNEVFKKSGHLWTTGHIRRILSNEAYIGNTVQCKIRKVSYKSKKTVRNDEENWIRVEDTHEPLVEKEVFYEIQKKLEKTSKKYNRLPGEGCLLSKQLICKDCGHRISVSWKSSKYHERGKSGVCNYYKKYSKHNVCTPHYIDYDELEEQVLDYVKQVVKTRLQILDTPRLIRENFKNIQNIINEQSKILEIQKKDLDKAENVMLKMYEDKLNEKITETMFQTLSQKKTIEIDELKSKVATTDKKVKDLQNQLDNSLASIKEEKEIIKRFLDSAIITQDTISLIIDKIYVGENNQIDVVFSINQLNEVKI